jgi:membrane-associated protein
MEQILSSICQHADHAHFFIFLLFLLAGINIPISADILILGGGAIASTCLEGNTFSTWLLFIWIYLGTLLSAWESYWLGRLLGPKLFHVRLFKWAISRERIRKLKYYFEKFGIWTFLIGRFIPGGVRNAIFMAAGLSKMPFNIFILRDSLGALLLCTVLFSIGYLFGQHLSLLTSYFYRYAEVVLALLILLLFSFIGYSFANRKR